MGQCFSGNLDTHDCNIQKELDKGDIQRPPQTPQYVKLFDKFRVITSISGDNPLTKKYFRSNAAIQSERHRHAKSGNTYVIHPYSIFSYYRQRMLVLLWLMALYKNTFTMAFSPRFVDVGINKFWMTFDFCVDVFLMIDIILNFVTGYQVKKTKEIVLDQRKIIFHYLKTYFFFELIGTIPMVDLVIAIDSNIKNCTLLYLTFLRAGRFVRLHTMLQYMEEWGQVWQLNMSVITSICQLTMSIYYLHWMACLVYTIPCADYYRTARFPKTSWVYMAQLEPFRNKPVLTCYLHSFLCVVCHFFNAGTGMYQTTYIYEQVFLSLCCILGLFYDSYLLSLLIQIFGSFSASETKYEELIHQLQEYMRSKRLPNSLRRRLLVYYETKFQKHYFKEQAILSNLPEHLRCEIHLHNCRSLIYRVNLFQGLSRTIIGSIIAFLKPEVYLPGDVVAKFGDPCEDVWFISYGKIAIYKADGKEVCHLEDGQYFGGSQLLQNTEEKYSVNGIAISVTELFRMSKKDFHRIIQTNREFKRRLIKFAAKYNTMLHKEDDESVSDVHDQQKTILSELRRGRILEKPKERKAV